MIVKNRIACFWWIALALLLVAAIVTGTHDGKTRVMMLVSAMIAWLGGIAFLLTFSARPAADKDDVMIVAA